MVLEPAGEPDAERDLLLTYLFAQRSDRVRQFLRRHHVRGVSQTLPGVRAALEAAFDRGDVGLADLIAYLDEVEPWGRQHVVFLDAPEDLRSKWSDSHEVKQALDATGNGAAFESALTVVLPSELTLSSVRNDGIALSIVAVEARHGLERDPDRDMAREEAAEVVEYRAYRHVVTRGLLTFRWEFSANHAYIHITQGGRHYDYIDATNRLAQLIDDWFPIARFAPSDLRPLVASIHRLEQAASRGEIRSHAVRYSSRGGREVQVSSPTSAESVLDEESVREALEIVIAARGTSGHAGNFYWLRPAADRAGSPLSQDMHVVVQARDSRLYLMRPGSPEEILHVLHRVREILGS